jgi:hypothetical protein
MASQENRVKMVGNKVKAVTIAKPVDACNWCIVEMNTEY